MTDTDRKPDAPPRLHLAEWRRAFGLSQKELAGLAGLSRKTVVAAEGEGRRGSGPHPETIKRFALVFCTVPSMLYQSPTREAVGDAVPQRHSAEQSHQAAARRALSDEPEDVGELADRLFDALQPYLAGSAADRSQLEARCGNRLSRLLDVLEARTIEDEHERHVHR